MNKLANDAPNTVTLTINNLKCTVQGPPQAHFLLADKLSLPVKGAHFSDLYKNGQWDGVKRFYALKTKSFDTGLLRWARQLLLDGGFHCEVKDARVRPPVHYCSMEGFKTPLRDYQEDAVRKAVKATRGVIYAATGSGKTEISFAIIHLLNLKSIFIVNSIDLLNQTAERIEKTIPSSCVKIIGDSTVRQLGTGEPWIYVATMQTLNKKPELIKGIKFDVKISDECHGVAAKTWKKVMDSIDAYYAFGLSGSFDDEHEDPIRYAEIVGSTGHPIVKITSSELVEQGHLVKPDITMLQYTNANLIVTDNYNTAVDRAIVEDVLLNTKIIPAIVRKMNGKKLLILVRFINHGKSILAALQKRGIPSVYVNGGNSGDERKRAITALRTGQVKVLIASNIFNQGVDIPEIEAILNLGCDKTYKSIFQKLGRGLRNSHGKTGLVYYDIWPKHCRFLDSASDTRRETYEYMGFTPKVVNACRYLGIAYEHEVAINVQREPQDKTTTVIKKPKATSKAYWDENQQRWREKIPKYVPIVPPKTSNSTDNFKRLHEEKQAEIRNSKRMFLLNKIK